MPSTNPISPRQPTLLVISQVYVPDPASVGQHMADAAAELAGRGNRVLVYTSAKAMRTLAASTPGESAAMASGPPLAAFQLWKGLAGDAFARRGPVPVSGRPSGPAPAAIGRCVDQHFAADLRPGRAGDRLVAPRSITYWVMDINPDQAVALGHVRQGGWRCGCSSRSIARSCVVRGGS